MKSRLARCLLSVFVGAGFCLADASALEFEEVSGNWVLDLDYVHRLWKAERGAQYDAAEWQRYATDPEEIDTGEEVRLGRDRLGFFTNGRRKVDYPVVGIVEESDVVWVDFKHFIYGEMRMGFVRDGANLKTVHSDGRWKLFAGYQRAE